jgi:hypothetical protein
MSWCLVGSEMCIRDRLLTTECVIADEPEEAGAHMHGGMPGGMPGMM